MGDPLVSQGFGSQSSIGSTSYNPGMGSVGIRLRLDPSDILRDFELFLRRAKIQTREDDRGNYIEEMVSIGQPLANEEGIAGIMGYLRFEVSPHNVQGNLTWDRYDKLIYEIHVDLAETLMAQLHKWDIRIEDYNFILDGIMHTLQTFLSRCVDNKERESYTESMKTEERSVLKPEKKDGWFGGVF